MRTMWTLLALWLSALAAHAQDAANPYVSDAIGIFTYGVYCAVEPTSQDPAPDTASGMINRVTVPPEFQFVEKRVPADFGIAFGLVATLDTGQRFDEVIVTVTHPPYPDSGISVERWTTDMSDLSPSLMGFTFERASELVLGDWTFSAHTPDGRELLSLTFEVVDPALMPHIIQSCIGNATS